MEIVPVDGIPLAGSTVRIAFNIKNNGSSTLHAGPVTVPETTLFRTNTVPTGTVSPGGEGRFSIVLEYKPFSYMGLREEDFHITFTFQSAGCKQIFHYPSVVAAGPLLDIRHPCPRDDKQKLNILVFGIAGAGKSSLINGFATILSTNPRDLVQPMAVLGGVDHATRTLQRLRFGEEGRTFNFNLWDTWGLTAETWNSMELKRVMEGQFPSGWEMSQMDAESVALLAQGASTRHLRAPNATVDGSEIEMIRATFAKLRDFNPLLVVTKVDELDRAPSWRPCARRPPPGRGAPNRIFLVCNYLLSDTERCLNIELPLMAVLYDTLKQARTNAEQRLTYSPEQLVWDTDT
ncbi:hypothetical protein PAPYR_7810 [Paratrimastix pyriformis]|uniref:G domain-containing protein n=1 Tax=Paratrimastix pyriformis TaxID=342808 RepID=A0ABQ8UC74_9EUKA|nr:hypothetical protein PAPYR_7810 [Paratrimastix pyriformis]